MRDLHIMFAFQRVHHWICVNIVYCRPEMTSPQAPGEFGEIGSTFFHENEENLQVGLMSSWWTSENIHHRYPQMMGWEARRLGVVGYIIIWLQKERWQLASGKFWDPLSMGPKKLRSSVFQMGEFWLYMICALVVPWLRMVGNHWLVNHVMSWIRNSFIPEVMVLMDRQVVDLPTGRENFGDVSCWRRVARFWEDLSMHLPRCCWATTSCEASVLCTRRFHRENSLKITVICEHLIILWMSKHATYAILRPYLKDMDPAFPCEGVVNLDVWKLLGPQLSVTIFVPCRLEDMWMFMGFGIA